MKKTRNTCPEYSYELIYADDVNFVPPSDIKLDKIEAIFCKWGINEKQFENRSNSNSVMTNFENITSTHAEKIIRLGSQ